MNTGMDRQRRGSLFTLLLLGLALLGVLAGVLGFSPSADVVGATFTVDSTVDAVDANPGDGVCATAAGECTLRAAVQETNAVSGGDTIFLPAGAYILAIPGSQDDLALKGDLDITDNLIITRTGEGTTIVDGNASDTGDRVFHIIGPATVALSHFRITHGESDQGGGIYNSGILSLDDISVAGNDTTGEGGGIYNRGTLTITNSRIDHNIGSYFTGIKRGAGIYSRGDVTIENTSLSHNHYADGTGGAIYMDGDGTLSVRGCTMHTNSGSDSLGRGAGAIHFVSTGRADIRDCVFGNNTTTIYNVSYGTMTFTQVTITDSSGLGIDNWGTLAVRDSTIANTLLGGIANDGTLLVENTTIVGNTGWNGGGISAGGTVTITNSTIISNTASGGTDPMGNGGGVFITGVVTINNSTITGNMARRGGGLFNEDTGTTTVRNSIIADNHTLRGGPDCRHTIFSAGYNLVGNSSNCSFISLETDQVGTAADPIDPLLGPLQDNGGPTPTSALLPGGPAIDTGDPVNCLPTDQRGYFRPVDGDGNGSAICDIGAYEFGSGLWPDFTLTAAPLTQAICAPADALYDVRVDSILGYSDPVVLNANGHPDGATATFDPDVVTPPGSSVLTIGETGATTPGLYHIEIVGVAPTSTHTVTVGLGLYNSPPAAPELLSPPDGATYVPRHPLLTWNAAAQASTYHLEIAADPAFATLVYSATLETTAHTLTAGLEPRALYYWRVWADNACGLGADSPVFTFTTAPTDFTLTATPPSQSICIPAEAVYDITLTGLSDPVTLNALGYPDGTTAIFNPNPVTTPGSSVLTIGDTDKAAAGSYTITITGIAPTATHTTTVGVNLYSALPGSFTLLSPPDEAMSQPLKPTFIWSAAFQSEFYDIQIATDSSFTDIVDSATGLAATTYVPGLFFEPETTYYWRVRATNICGTSNSSAVFSFTTAPISFSTLIVDSVADAVDANPGDGLCATAAGDCTLRAAIQEANAATGWLNRITILISPGIYTLTLPGSGEDGAATGDLDITAYITIEGAGAETTTVSGNGVLTGDRVFHVLDTAQVTISGLTIRDGKAAVEGGGIFNSGILTVTTSSLTANDAAGYPYSGGGAIYNSGILLVESSVLYGNTANDRGAGLYNEGSASVATVSNSTISGNIADYGGGLFDDEGLLTLDNSTNNDNTALSVGGGLYNVGGQVNSHSSIWANNSVSYSTCYGSVTSQGYNLVDDEDGCGFSNGPGDLIGTSDDPIDPLLGPLQDNGGPTWTHALLLGSPAIDAGHPLSCPATDQRGYFRPVDGDGNGSAICDIGAYEVQ